jgi:TolB-like protein/DNA-binding winged helix-turn-helix (wHTH) protein
METTPSFGQIFRFGAFEVDVSRGELRKRGIRLALQEQPFRILAALLERPGEVVSREDLCRRLWPQGTFVDFEHSLNAAVRRLRVTLGDEAETPRFIETIHRRGYRFLAWEPFPRAERPGPTSSVPAAASSVPGIMSNVGLAFRPGDRLRLAVLPFIWFGRDDRQDAFSDGLTEEIITQLARACPPNVGVIARTSVMRLSASPHSAAEAGRMLGADYLVEGSVRREGDRVRIVAQLIESHEETHVWAATFDRVMADTLTLQSEVAEHIARAVARALNGKEPLLSREAAS